MSDETPIPRRRGGRGVRPWLILVKLFGLALFLGSLASLAAFMLLAPPPETMEGWHVARHAMSAIFWPCFFGGLVVTILAGIALWLQHPKVFLRMRWFKLKVVLLAIAIPSLHLWARGRALRFDAALDAGELDALPGRWRALGVALLVAFGVFVCLAAVARFKPRLGERVGARRG